MEESKTPLQPYFASTIEEYLRNENAIGIKFNMAGQTAHSVNMYIQCGIFSDISNSSNRLQTECRLSEKVLYNILLEQLNNPAEHINKKVQQDTDYKSGISELMQTYPQLKDASICLDSDTIFEHLYIAGRPAHQAVTYMLNLPNMPTVMLGDMLVMNSKIETEIWGENMHTDMQQLQQLFKNPPSVHSKFGAERFYFFEKGKLGFATIHPDRTVKWFGEKLSGLAQGHINRVATRANIIYLDRPFFNNKALGRVYIPSADKETEKFRNIYIQKYDDGTRTTDVFMENAMPLKDWNPEKLISMKGRLTQVQFMEREDGHYMRCRIDGEQQMYKHVNPDDYTGYQKGVFDAEHLAAKYFVRDFLSMQEERSQGMKR